MKEELDFRLELIDYYYWNNYMVILVLAVNRKMSTILCESISTGSNPVYHTIGEVAQLVERGQKKALRQWFKSISLHMVQ